MKPEVVARRLRTLGSRALLSCRRGRRQLRLPFVRRLAGGDLDPTQALLLTSTPRSGSTWLAQILASARGAAVLFEPLNIAQVPGAREAGFTWRHSLPADAAWPQGRDFLEDVFAGRVLNSWTTWEMDVRTAARARFLVVKSVRAGRLLPWICRNFQLPPPILLMRHPCAVVASQLRASEDWNDASPPQAPEFLARFPAFIRLLEELQEPEEFLAASWALDQLPALLVRPPRPWQIVCYEDVLARPRATVEGVFAVWGKEVPETVQTAISRPSSTTYRGGASGAGGWTRQLSPEQVGRVLRVAHGFGLDFYGHDPEPARHRMGEETARRIQERGTGR